MVALRTPLLIMCIAKTRARNGRSSSPGENYLDRVWDDQLLVLVSTVHTYD